VAAMMSPIGEEFIPETKVVEPLRPVAIGNTAAAAQPKEHTDEDYEETFQANVTSLMQQRIKNRL